MINRLNSRTAAILVACIAGCAPAASPPPTTSTPTPPPLQLPPAQAPTEPSPAAKQDKPEQADAPLDPSFVPETAKVETAVTESPQEPDSPFVLEDGFTPLSFSDFESFQAEPETWTPTDDGIRCTGKPKGYLYSLASHQNFTWKLEYRFDRPKSLKDETKFKGNTGFLVYITGEHKQWPVCLEVQGKHAEMADIKENGGAAPVTVQDDDAARQAARKPVGEWNRVEIISREGSITTKLNDVPISRSEPNFLSEGKIGIQAEDHPFVVRRMRIKDE